MAGFPCNGPLEVVFSFDTTGSMYSCLEQVRGRLQDMIQRLQSDIPGIRMAVIAHGDYCDRATYVTKWVDLTTDIASLCDFVKNVAQTGGGDSPECYELVLRQARTELSWTPGSKRALVLIGDDEPHGSDYGANVDNIDWKEETKQLAFHGVTIYGVQCHNYKNAEYFYRTLAMATGGKHLRLDDFGSLFDVLMAVCYREGNDTAMLASYEKEVRARCGAAGIGADIDAIFTSLRRDDGDSDAGTTMSTFAATAPAPVGKKRKAHDTTKDSPLAKKVKTTKALSVVAKPPRPISPRHRVARPKSNRELLRYHVDNLPLLKRENVAEKNFGLRHLRWSPWIPVLSADEPDEDQLLWVKRRGQTGYRLRMVKPVQRISNNQRPVLFEMAVQTPGSGKLRHVVYNSFSTRLLNNASWENRCLSRISGQLERVLQNGCKVHLRYSCISKQPQPTQLRGHLKRYDYAWKRLRHVRSHARDVTKGKYPISMDESH